jgi:alpha-beta hydrolase superfamily lysophospholipase
MKNQDNKVSLHKVYSTDGIELDSILFEPIDKTEKIIIHIHGKEGHFIQNHFITHMGSAYPKAGYAFLTFNNRGHDYMADLLRKTSTGYMWEQGGSVFDILEDNKNDIQGIIDYAKDLGYKEIILQGHSLGPHKICYYLSQTPNHSIAKVILLTTADVRYQFDSSVPEWEKWSLVAKRMLDEGKGKDLMPIKLWSNCSVSAATFWNYTKPDTNCFVFNGTHPEIEYKNFNKITLPMLIINPENDNATGIKQEKAIELLRKNSLSIDLTTHIIREGVHNFLGKEEELIAVITNWLT